MGLKHRRWIPAAAVVSILLGAMFLGAGESDESVAAGAGFEHAVDYVEYHATPSATSGPEDEVFDVCSSLIGQQLAYELCALQYDGNEHGDATEICGASTRVLTVPSPPQPPRTGLVHGFDESDHYAIDVVATIATLVVVVEASPMSGGVTQFANLDIGLRVVIGPSACGPAVGVVNQLSESYFEVVLQSPPVGMYDLRISYAGPRLGPLSPDAPNGLDGAQPLGSGIALNRAAIDFHSLGQGQDDMCHGACAVAGNRLFGYQFGSF